MSTTEIAGKLYGATKREELDHSTLIDIVKCNNCETFHYDEAGGRLDTHSLQLLYDEGHPYKGCGNCGTDDYLMDLD